MRAMLQILCMQVGLLIQFIEFTYIHVRMYVVCVTLQEENYYKRLYSIL